MPAAFYYSPDFSRYALSRSHPLSPVRGRRAYELLLAYGAFGPETPVIEPRPADLRLVRLAHDDDYLDALQRLSDDPTDRILASAYGLGSGDTPAFSGLWEASLLYSGATVDAAELILSGADGIRRAQNVAGGLHHAMADRASGFCILNDAAIAIHRMLEMTERVAYLDIDVHHGDGVESLFYREPRVLTVSLHESGRWLFPRTGYPSDAGEGAGKGTAINVPLAPGTGDDLYLRVFHEVVPRALETFRPDAIVTQFGSDARYGDPLAHLALTTNAYEAMLRYFDGLDLPWLVLGGGGYDPEAAPRVWALAFGALAGISLPDALPKRYLDDWGGDRLRDGSAPPSYARQAEDYRAEEYARNSVATLKRELGWDGD